MIPVLLVANLAVSIRKKAILQGVGFSISCGEHLVILGKNGSGKSTLLNAIAGCGPQKLKGIELWGQPAARYGRKTLGRRLAVTPQNPLRPAAVTVEQFIMLGRYPWLHWSGLYGTRDREALADSLKKTNLETYANRILASLSGGEWQRANLARAFCQIYGSEQPLMLLDEPTASLDPAMAINIFAILENFRREGAAIVTVVHDCNLGALFATRMLGLKEGRVAFYGEARQVFNSENLTALYDQPMRVWRRSDEDLPQAQPLIPKSLLPDS